MGWMPTDNLYLAQWTDKHFNMPLVRRFSNRPLHSLIAGRTPYRSKCSIPNGSLRRRVREGGGAAIRRQAASGHQWLDRDRVDRRIVEMKQLKQFQDIAPGVPFARRLTVAVRDPSHGVRQKHLRGGY